MARRRALRRLVHQPRRLALEALEPRAVPAGLVHDFMLPAPGSNGTGAVLGPDDIRVSAYIDNLPVIYDLDRLGAIQSTMHLPLPDGWQQANVSAISENGRWAVGLARSTTGPPGANLLVIWDLQNPTRPVGIA